MTHKLYTYTSIRRYKMWGAELLIPPYVSYVVVDKLGNIIGTDKRPEGIKLADDSRSCWLGKFTDKKAIDENRCTSFAVLNGGEEYEADFKKWARDVLNRIEALCDLILEGSDDARERRIATSYAEVVRVVEAYADSEDGTADVGGSDDDFQSPDVWTMLQDRFTVGEVEVDSEGSIRITFARKEE